MQYPSGNHLKNTLNLASVIIAKYEGLSLKPYLCPAGVPSIGYGNTRLANGTAVTMQTPPITKEQADALLLDTVQKTLRSVCNLLTLTNMEDWQLAALTSLAYNIGIGNFRRSTLLAKINSVSNVPLSPYWLEWNQIKGKKSEGLLNRRKAEYSLYLGAQKTSKGL